MIISVLEGTRLRTQREYRKEWSEQGNWGGEDLKEGRVRSCSHLGKVQSRQRDQEVQRSWGESSLAPRRSCERPAEPGRVDNAGQGGPEGRHRLGPWVVMTIVGTLGIPWSMRGPREGLSRGGGNRTAFRMVRKEVRGSHGKMGGNRQNRRGGAEMPQV